MQGTCRARMCSLVQLHEGACLRGGNRQGSPGAGASIAHAHLALPAPSSARSLHILRNVGRLPPALLVRHHHQAPDEPSYAHPPHRPVVDAQVRGLISGTNPPFSAAPTHCAMTGACLLLSLSVTTSSPPISPSPRAWPATPYSDTSRRSPHSR